MATIFEQLEGALGGSELTSKLGVQADALGSITSLLGSLKGSPPAAIGDFASALDELPLPELDAAGGLLGQLNAIKGAVPGADAIGGAPAQALGSITSSVGDELSHGLANVLAAVSALERLTQLDLRCVDGAAPPAEAATEESPGDGGGGTPPPPAPAPPPAAAAGVKSARTVLEAVPDPLDLPAILDLLHRATDWDQQRDGILPHLLPLLDDVADPLATLLDWQGKSAAQVRPALVSALNDAASFVAARRDAAVAAATTTLATVAGDLQAGELQTIADGLVSHLAELKSAVDGGDVSGTGAAVSAANALLDGYDALRPTFDAAVLAHAPSVEDALGGLAGDLEDQMALVVSGLTSPTAAPLANKAASAVTAAASLDGLSELTDWLGTYIGWFQDLIAKLDLDAVASPLKTVADGARAALDGFEEAVTEATLAVETAFKQVESLVDGIDTAGLATGLQGQIQGFADQLVGELAQLFAPVREAVSEAVSAIDSAVGAFDPAQIVAELQSAIDAVTGVLAGPEVTAALADVKQAVQAIVDALKSISFEPVADEVVKDLNGIGDTLRQLDPSSLPGPLQDALKEALQVIPSDLKPITDPLVADFNDLVEGGPVPLLQSVKDKPQRLLDQVNSFDPASLVGDALEKPFASLVAELDGFKPSSLLQPVHDQLDAIKQRLQDQADPAKALEPLEQPFHDLLAAFDSLKPDELVKPLQDAISSAIDSVLDTLPVQATLDALDAVVGRVQGYAAFGDDVVAVLQRLHDVAAAVADARDGLAAFAEPILAAVDSAASTPSVTTALTALGDAVASTTAAALAQRVDDAVDPTVTALASLDPHARLAGVAQAYHGVSRTKLAALASSPEQATIAALLDRFDPMQPAFAAPYEALAGLRKALADAKAAAHGILDADWDAVFHGPGGALAELHDLGTVQPGDAVRALVTQRLVEPLAALFSIAEPVGRGVDGVLSQVKRLVTDLDGKLAQLVTGPDSLGGIKDTLEQLVQRLHAVDLGVVAQSLDALTAQVRGKLEALDPANLAAAVSAAFDEVLGALDLPQAIPVEDVQKLDDDYAAVVAKVKALDPKALVTDVVKPAYEQKVLPLLDAFDLTPLLQAIVDRLQALETDLGTQIDKVDAAFTQMRSAVPAAVAA